MNTIEEINKKFLNGERLEDEELTKLFSYYEELTRCVFQLDDAFSIFKKELWTRKVDLRAEIESRHIELPKYE